MSDVEIIKTSSDDNLDIVVEDDSIEVIAQFVGINDATQAAASAAEAASTLDAFDDRYLGAKLSEPSTDNDGDALAAGALFFDLSNGSMKVYDGAAWQAINLSALNIKTLYESNADTNAFTDALLSKLNGIEASADVTDFANVSAALAAATTAVDFNTQNITNVGTVDGRDVSTDGTKLDTVETNADVTDFANVSAALAAATTAVDFNTRNITNVGTVDGRDVSTDGTKLDGIEAGATADQTAGEIKTLYESNADTNAFTDAEQTKVGHLTVTQAVDLDEIETRVNDLDAAIILRGTWDASTGAFPGGGTAQAGDSYIVSVGGTVDGVAFAADDRLIAIADNASTSTYAGNWHKADYTDLVQSIFGRTGAVTAQAGDYEDGQITAAAAATNYTPSASHVEGHLGGIDTALGGRPTSTELASTANGDGASRIGIEDAAGNFDGTNVEDALAEAANSSMPGVFNVLDYGADNTAASDSTTTIQDAIDAAKAATTSPLFGSLDTAARVYFPPGIYSVDTLDCTGAAGLSLYAIPGTVIIYADQQSTNKPVIDLTGSSQCEINGIIAAGQTPAGGDPSVLPTVGFLVAETTAGGDNNKNRLINSGTLGKFTTHAVMVFGATDNVFDFCAFQQDKEDANCLFIGTSNPGSVTSPHATIATAPSNAGDNTFLQCEFHGHRSSSATVETTRIFGADNIRFYGGNHDNSGPYHVQFNGTNKQILFSGVKFYSESGHAADDVFFNNNASVLRLGIENVHTEDNAFSDNFIDGSGSPDYSGGWIKGVRRDALSGPYLYFFAEPYPVVGGPAINLAGDTTKFLVMGSFDTNEANCRMPTIRDGVFVGLRVKTGGSPGAGESYAITVRKNGVDTALAATVSDGNTTAENLTDVVAFDAGNEVSIEADPSATANNTGSIYASLGFIPA